MITKIRQDLIQFRWSFSRVQVFRECLRKYYLDYIVPRLPEEALDAHLRKNILFLRQLSNRYLLLGQVLHTHISLWIERLFHPGEVTLRQIIEGAWEEFQARFQFSRREQYLYRPEADPHYTVLMEHIYGQPVSDAMLGDLYQRIKRSLRNLSVWNEFQQLQQLTRDHILQKEELQPFEIEEIPVWVKLDLLYRDPLGRLTVIDWKARGGSQPEDVLQLALYGLYTARIGKRDSVRLLNFYLTSGVMYETLLTEKLRQAAIAYVRKTHDQIARFHQQVVEGKTLGDLQPEYRQEVCTHCKFRKICFPRNLARERYEQSLKNKTIIYDL